MSIHEPLPDPVLPPDLAGLGETEVYVAPSSFAQQRLWLIDRLSPGLAAYNVPVAFRLRGSLDAASLEGALAEVVARHETLRTSFGEEDGELVQLIVPELAPRLPLVDMTALPAGDREEEALRQIQREAARPFDLERAPLLRPYLFRLAEAEHLALFNFHHIIVDAWSHGVFLRELLAAYEALQSGAAADLPELPIQYADYADWQRQWLQGEALEIKLTPWRRRLQGAPATLDLPTDRPRSREVRSAGASLPVALSASLTAALRELGRESGATLFMVQLAAFQALLFRHSGQTDLVVGAPVANRNRVETEGLIGFFTNTLVLRAEMGDDPTFRDHLARVRDTVIEAFAHEDLPLEKLVEELRPDRRLNQNPLFQVLFSFHHTALPSGDPASLSLEILGVHTGAAKMDLSLDLVEGRAGIEGLWEHSTALFDHTTIARLSEHWQTMLAAAADDPNRRLSEIRILPEPERHQILTEWSQTSPPARRTRLVHEVFEAQADRDPEAVAAVFDDLSLTYRELEARANRLARHLQGLGVGASSLVGLCVERSLDLPVAVLGILKAGGAYLPLDPAYPPDRLAFMAEDAGISALVTQQELADRVPCGSEVPVVRLDADRPQLDLAPGHRAFAGAAGAGPEDLAYQMYTSGSTGRPKGIAMPHRALANMIDWQLASTVTPPGAATLQFASLSFDVSFQEMFATWAAGGVLVLVSEAMRREPPELLRLLAGRRVARLYQPFIALQQLARSAEPPQEVPPSLGEVITAGEQLQITPQIRAFFARLPGCVLQNHYGPSEAHVVTSLRLDAGPRAWPSLPGIGRPIDGAWVFVLDSSLRPVPIGVPGELYVGGVCLARGYHGRPDLTAESFVPHPLALGIDAETGPGSRLYRTGDLARLLAGGSIEYLGRRDGQVKVRGVRLEPAEVEAALAAHPAVAECAVVARPGASGELALVAYLAARRGQAPTARQLREFLAGKLPESMVPGIFVSLPMLPRTPSGKVDRKALPAPSLEAAAEDLTAPRTPIEEVLSGIWSEVLGVDRIGPQDNFFDLGGHSLTATSVTSQARSTFKVELPTRAIFEAPTLAELAERVEKLIHADQGLEIPPIVPRPRIDGDGDGHGDGIPLSFAQQRLWFLDELAGGASPFYNLSAPLGIDGPLNAALLERTLGEVIRRHEALRTTFRIGEGGQPVQVVHAPRHRPLPIVDLQALPHGEIEGETARAARQVSVQPFDLAQGPLLRFLLIRKATDRHVLALAMHHVVSDGWSIGILNQEMATLYGAFVDGSPSPLPELPVQYPDFALWQRRWLAGPALEAQLAFWRQHLAGAPLVLELPADRPRPAVQRFEGGTALLPLPDDLVQSLEAFAREHRVTMFMVLFAAFATLLQRYTGREDLLIGSPIANRNHSETEGLIGFFVNVLALRADLSGEPDSRQLLARVREAALGAYAYQDLPFEALVEELQPERSLSTNPLVQVILNLQEAGAQPELPGLDTRPFHFPGQASIFDLALSVARGWTAAGSSLALSFNYKRALFDAATPQRMLDELRLLLEGAVAHPEMPVSALSLWSEAAWHQVAREWNDTRTEHERAITVDRLFERMAQRSPGALAVSGAGESLTYGELNARANQLARRLRHLGVRLDSRVAVGLERSPDLVVAAVAAAKAGGAYLPVDPAAPAERLALMIEDAQAPVVITRERWMETFSGTGAAVLCLDADAEAIAAESAEDLSVENLAAGPSNLSYVIYTSGSTGRPKGVELQHAELLHVVSWYHRRFGITPGDRVSLAASAIFDASVCELWAALSSGASLHVPPAEAVPSPADFLRWLAAERVTRCFLPTVLAEGFLYHEPPEGLALRTFCIGGDRCPRPPAGLGFDLVDYYGPTEITVLATSLAVDPAERASIGRPIDDVEVYLLDRRLRPVPLGAAGEICIGGEGVSRGYGARPGLTAERFVPHPFAALPGARLYRSGDLARFLANGRLEFLGRTDHQVKLRGFRIELGEVEAALARHPGVRESAVVMREIAPGELGLAAYYVPAAEPSPEPADLRLSLRRTLPDYMIPAVFCQLDSLPRTPTGKPDRQALPDPDQRARESYVEPGTPTERTLAGLWCELLGVERVGAEDDFFALGGHSLLAVRLASRLRDRFQIELATQLVFESPVLAAMARAVDDATATGEPTDEPVMTAMPRTARQPKSPAV